MGRGRAPCCDKTQVKSGPWSPAEDLRLIAFIQKNGHENWRSLPKQAGLARCGKSCRLRWINYLRPDVKRGNFTPEEEDTIIKLHQSMGNKWARIASCLPGRTDNEIKNVWNTHLKKRAETKESSSNNVSSNITSSSPSSTSSSSSCNKSNVSKAKRKIDQLLVEDHDHMTKNPNCGQNKTVTLPSEDTATMSDDSHVTNVVHRYTMNKKVSSEEVNKPLVGFVNHEDSNINVLDIHNLEADFDLWSMLDMDNLVSGVEDSSFGGEAEQKKWLEDLETELGLEVTKEQQSHDHDPKFGLF